MPHSSPEELSESVHKQVPMHALGEQLQSQSLPPQASYPQFMQEFVQAIRDMAQRSKESTLDENFKKIRKQGAKSFIRTTDPMVAEEWLRSTERVLNRFDYTTEKRVSYAVSLFKQDALDLQETVSGSWNVPMMIT